MTLEAALAVLAHSRTDLYDVAKTLCALATLSFALRKHDRCSDSVDAAGELLRERGRGPDAIGQVS
jgi:hypothetical protein